MAIITFTKKELKKFLGNSKDEDIDYKPNMAGLGVEKMTSEEVDIEITPNRPDLLSVQGVKRYLEFYFKRNGFKEYITKRPEKNYKVMIDKSVKKVRPYTACAIVKGLKFEDEKIREIIDIQEKLHDGYGRNRKKFAIGIYPLEKIKLPIKFLAKEPEKIKFQPLDSAGEMNGKEILSQHPVGIKYEYLLKDCLFFPVFEDFTGEILSMPPIINSEKTGKITKETKEVFVECSGFNYDYLKKVLAIIVCSLADMGGKIYAMEIKDKTEKKNYLSPDLKPEKMKFSPDYLNQILGINLSENKIKKLFAKMGIGLEKKNLALIPQYRVDILHEIDLVEEIAIAYGYDKFEPETPKISTIGKENEISLLKKKISEILVGLGMQEVSSYHLSTKEKQFKKMYFKEFKNKIIEVLDSKTENNILRISLLANSIDILSENSDVSYPQKIFELGKIFFNDEISETGIGEKESLCISISHEKANFTEIKQALDYLMRMLALEYEIREFNHPSFIEGRCGEIFIRKKSIGVIGEISPNVLKINKIQMPVVSLEIEIKELFLK